MCDGVYTHHVYSSYQAFLHRHSIAEPFKSNFPEGRHPQLSGPEPPLSDEGFRQVLDARTPCSLNFRIWAVRLSAFRVLGQEFDGSVSKTASWAVRQLADGAACEVGRLGSHGMPHAMYLPRPECPESPSANAFSENTTRSFPARLWQVKNYIASQSTLWTLTLAPEGTRAC